MDGARDQFLAGARLARDEDGQVGRDDARDDAIDVLHRRRAADQRQRRVLFRRGLGRDAAPRQRARHRLDQRVEVERLGQIVIRPRLRRADGSGQRVARGQDDRWQRRVAGGDSGEMLQPVAVGQHDVGDEDVGRRGGQRAGGGGERLDGGDIMPGAAQRLCDDGADRRVVIDHQDAAHASARGRRRRSTVHSGLPSREYWTMPPMSRISLSTSARPSPCPSGRPDTNGSNR